ncbi:MAG: hypothetical protein FWG40_03845 [Peptococcaceae bacterium]|nr:hypothetical protein [Peptococcaceae bacterium]
MGFTIHEHEDSLVALTDDKMILSVTSLRTGSEEVSFSLRDEEAVFFESELMYDLKGLRQVRMDIETANEWIRALFHIETEEVYLAAGRELSERGQMAGRLVDIVHGPYEGSLRLT